MHKRAFAPVAVLGASALLMSACGSGDGGASSTTTTTASTTTAASSDSASASGSDAAAAAPTTMSTKDAARDASADLVIWSDSDRAPAVTKYAQQFGEENGIKVAVQIATDARQQFKDATKVGKGPDIVVGAHDWAGELVQNGTISPIPLDQATQDKFLPSAMAGTKFNGQIYGVPYAIENIGLLRNTALAPEAPKTMDDIVAKGTELKKAGKVSNVLIQFVGKQGNAYYAYPYLAAFGGGIFGTKANGDYDPAKVVVNSAESVKGGEVLAKLGKEGVLTTNIDDTNMDQLFDSGKAAYMITGPWSVAPAKKAGIKYAIDPLPSLAGGEAMKPFTGVQMFYVSAKAKNAALAQEFVTNYVTKKEVQLALFEAGQRPPALKEAYDEVAASNPDIKAWFEAGKDGKPMPNIPAMNSVWQPFGQATADIISQKAQPKARLDAAQKEIVANIAKG